MDSTTLRSAIETLNPSKPAAITKDARVQEAIDRLTKNNYGCLCVVEDENLIGIVTERDILTKVVAGGLDPLETTVGEIMTDDPEYLFIDDQIAFALNRMHVGGFRHIPLINLKGQPTGIVSVRDILKYLVNSIHPTT